MFEPKYRTTPQKTETKLGHACIASQILANDCTKKFQWMATKDPRLQEYKRSLLQSHIAILRHIATLRSRSAYQNNLSYILAATIHNEQALHQALETVASVLVTQKGMLSVAASYQTVY